LAPETNRQMFKKIRFQMIANTGESAHCRVPRHSALFARAG
jgi:hypothetical protein